MVQEKKPAKPPARASNGAGAESPSTPSKAAHLPPLFPSIVVAIIAFVGGVLTPPSLHAYRSVTNASIPSDSFPLPLHAVPCTPSNLDKYLHAKPIPGLHLICIEQLSVGEDGKEQALPPTSDANEQRRRLGQIDSLRFTIYKGSHSGPLRRRIKVGGGSQGVQSIAWPEVKLQLIRELGLAPEGKLQQPWALFTALGERIVGENDNVLGKGAGEVGSNQQVMASIAASGMVVIAQGGNWMWPGVREGFERTIELAPMDDTTGKSVEPRNITIETLSMVPLVLSIKGFLTEEECDHIAEKAGPSMRYSSVSLKDADKGRAASDWRTSQSTFLSSKDDPMLRAIEDRTASLTRVPRNHQEYVQVLRYGTDEKYDAHHDYFDPKAYQSDENTLRLIENGKKNRFATVFWYLTDVDDGGHTIFPRAGGRPPVRSHKDCTKGLKVQPQKGKVIIFYSLDAAGAMDEYSLHGACPVGEGNVKWAANKWIWNAPMGYVT